MVGLRRASFSASPWYASTRTCCGLTAPRSAAQAFLLAAQKNLLVRGPFAYVIALVTAWGFLWPLLGLGAALWPRDAARQFCVTAALLLAGGFFSSLIAADVGRMFTPLSVLVACACAQLAATLWERGAGSWVYGLIGLSFLQAVFSITPRVFFSGHPGVFNNNGLRFVVLSVGLLFVAGMAWRLREALATAGRDNLVHLWNSRAVWFRSP